MSGGERMQRGSGDAVMFANSDGKPKDWRSLPRPSRQGPSKVGVCRWRGRLEAAKHAHPLVRALIREMNKQQTTMSEVSKRAGLNKGVIGGWARKNTPNVAHLEAALNVLGFQLVIQEIDE